MCGINGIIGLQDHKVREQTINTMNSSMVHRGPDDQGIYSDNVLSFGHRRLSIIDLSKHAHQPMKNDQCSLSFNGEIYNFKELKRELKDYPFQSDSDTEVILAAYQKWGIACLDKFNGMFSFALHDKQLDKVFLVRDRLGIKPLYYFHHEGLFIFSSEIRSLLASDLVPRKLNQDALNEYLSFQTVHAPGTLIEGVRLLEAANYLEVNCQTSHYSKTQWWKASSAIIDLSYSEAQSKCKELFYSAVERRLVSDVPFGAFLSGGIDSSAIVGAMADISSRPIETFNVSFAEEEFSEAKYARTIAKLNNTNHHEIKLSPNDFLNHLPDALNSIDHPSGDGPNTWIISQAIKEQGITMALSGLGGDELFAGYPIFERMKKLHRYQKLWRTPLSLRKVIANYLCKFKPSVASEKIREALLLPSFNHSVLHSISRKVLLNKQVDELIGNTSVKSLKNNKSCTVVNNITSQTSLREMETYMQHVLLRDSDQMSMAHSLELRVPFLDHELVEFALSLPDQLKPYGKKILVQSLKEKLPDSIVNRPKMGFVFPWEHWLRNELFSFAEENIHSINHKTLFRNGQVINLWNKFLKGDPSVSYSRLWPLVVLNHWMDKSGIQ